MKQLKTEIIILKRINYGEADRIITVLTPDYGKISLFARGIRKSKSKLAGGLELFSVSEVTIIDGRSDLKTIISARLKENFMKIIESIERTMIAYELLKLIDKYVHQTSEEGYFKLLLHGLESLQDSKLSPEATYVWFVFRLLTEFGGVINLEKPGNARQFDDKSNYSLSYEDMMFQQEDNGTFNAKHIKLLRLAVTLTTPKILNNVQDLTELLEEVLPMTKQIVQFQLQEPSNF